MTIDDKRAFLEEESKAIAPKLTSLFTQHARDSFESAKLTTGEFNEP